MQHPVSGKTPVSFSSFDAHPIDGVVSRYSTITQTFRSPKWNTIRQRRLNRVQCAIMH